MNINVMDYFFASNFAQWIVCQQGSFVCWLNQNDSFLPKDEVVLREYGQKKELAEVILGI